ncbi:MAG: hypothetical protein AMJ73_07420 [candidate division Zixibacteria bacterium SM1_73]|nr:MAG: hypothetical protein AMJ73_07420 [candidate division Zixibacteria bacterium SM1_73]
MLEASETFPSEIQNLIKTLEETRRMKYKPIKKIPGLDILWGCGSTPLCHSNPAEGRGENLILPAA